MAAVYREQFVREYPLAANRWYFTRPAVFSIRMGDAWFCVRTSRRGYPVDTARSGFGHRPDPLTPALSSPEPAPWLWMCRASLF